MKPANLALRALWLTVIMEAALIAALLAVVLMMVLNAAGVAVAGAAGGAFATAMTIGFAIWHFLNGGPGDPGGD